MMGQILVENEWGERLLVPEGSDPNLILKPMGLRHDFKWRIVAVPAFNPLATALGGIPTKPQDQGEFLTGKGQERFSEEQKKDGEVVSTAWKATKATGRSQWP